jgi:glucan phosphoethanolaminetransferase (alkaline phosphatase superfamily)
LVFFISLIIGLGIFAWFMQNETREMALMNFILWYDIIVNGILVGGFMLLLAIRTSEKWLKIKAFGGGTGVITCCVVSNGAMLSGALLASSFFGFLAPIVILVSLMFTKKKE